MSQPNQQTVHSNISICNYSNSSSRSSYNSSLQTTSCFRVCKSFFNYKPHSSDKSQTYSSNYTQTSSKTYCSSAQTSSSKTSSTQTCCSTKSQTCKKSCSTCKTSWKIVFKGLKLQARSQLDRDKLARIQIGLHSIRLSAEQVCNSIRVSDKQTYSQMDLQSN